MKKYVFAILAASITLCSCSNNNPHDNGTSTPIDSTNLNGTAPATYGPDNPTDDTMNKTNRDDTGTNANNVHGTPAH